MNTTVLATSAATTLAFAHHSQNFFHIQLTSVITHKS